MKSIIARKPYLTIRILISSTLQVLLVVLLHHPHPDSLLFNLCVLVVGMVAITPAALAPLWLPFWPTLMLRLLGLFPMIVFLATVLHLMGWSAWFKWLLRACAAL